MLTFFYISDTTFYTMKKQTRPLRTRTSHNKISVQKEIGSQELEMSQPGIPEVKFSAKKAFIAAGILVLLIIGGLFKRNRDQMVNLKKTIIPQAIEKITGGSMKVKLIDKVTEKSGVVSFEIVFDANGQEQRYTSYITKDGKIMFTSGTVLADVKANTAAGKQETPKMTCEDLKKADDTKITAFVVSQCPFGLQMQRVIAKAIEEQPLLAKNIDVKYIGSVENGKITAMHGEEEAQENLRQICIREEQSTLYWPYVSCYMKAGKTDECIVSSGVDNTKLTACTTDATRGLAYAQKDFDIANKYNISASPTMLGNDGQIVSEFDFGGRTADAMKQLVCCSSKTQGDYCKTDLSKDSVASSFSENTAGNGSSAAANCN